MPVRLRTDLKKLTRTLTRWERKQVPFAISLALNDVAFIYRKYTVNTGYPNAFPRARNKRFANAAFRVQLAKKRDLRSAVYDRLDRSFLTNHITGRSKRPFKSSALAVPVNAQRTATGRTRKRDAPTAPGTFVADRGRGPAVWRVKRGGLQLLYVLKQRTPINSRFRFYEIGAARARQELPRAFQRAIRRALATAR